MRQGDGFAHIQVADDLPSRLIDIATLEAGFAVAKIFAGTRGLPGIAGLELLANSTVVGALLTGLFQELLLGLDNGVNEGFITPLIVVAAGRALLIAPLAPFIAPFAALVAALVVVVTPTAALVVIVVVTLIAITVPRLAPLIVIIAVPRFVARLLKGIEQTTRALLNVIVQFGDLLMHGFWQVRQRFCVGGRQNRGIRRLRHVGDLRGRRTNHRHIEQRGGAEGQARQDTAIFKGLHGEATLPAKALAGHDMYLPGIYYPG
ncbi:MAG: hypothetical protein L0Y71_19240 [Gemmataceae bacterium]|nr:hypothetical protein [Gemmataceae bacterium]